MQPRIFALPRAILVPSRALILPTVLVLEVSALMEIASRKPNLALKAVNLVPLRALASPEAT